MRLLSTLLGTWLACACLGACSAPPAPADQQIRTAELKATLASLDLEHPWEDAKRHVAAGDLRPVGLYGFSCSVPGPYDPKSPWNMADIRCLDGTGDVMYVGEYTHLTDQATAYAMTYNWALKRALKSASSQPAASRASSP